ncbi:hypothetical protein J4N45_11060 [Vibrio sp. SCSIO 43140]|uniref:hypothetical protein n=1 Tax=Vibrio sp. SCSIO 43140 TaxID=2819100 RepID=UPI002074FE16|nr:hypothetical protein [Vibrio sp. SCSIO 43140]USD59070.1 hypothetical protein J4N45_11060 [Vibrio sp. SCSIO 43140]
MSNEDTKIVEVRPNEFEPLSESLLERCDGDTEVAGFFHCVGKVLSKEDNHVDSKYLKSNVPEPEASGSEN